MIIVCTSCQAKYKFDETRLGQRPKARTKCAKCGASIEIENPAFGAVTLPPAPLPEDAPPPEEATRKTKTIGLHPGETTGRMQRDASETPLFLAPGKRYSLAVIQGAATGQIFPVTKPRIVLGRAGADVELDDTEASRQHAALEIVGDHGVLRDLGSTNGTFIDSARIQAQTVLNQTEFRIGSHVLMFIITDVE
jgi:predicted Zn finger-like uncharacterized protein